MTRQPRPVTVSIAAGLQAICVLLAIAAIVLAWTGKFATDQDRYAAIALTALGVLVVGWFGSTLLPVLRQSTAGVAMAAAGAAFYELIALVLCICGGTFAFVMLPFIVMPDPFDMNNEPVPVASWQLVAASVTFLVIGVLLFAVMVLLTVAPLRRLFSADRHSTR